MQARRDVLVGRQRERLAAEADEHVGVADGRLDPGHVHVGEARRRVVVALAHVVVGDGARVDLFAGHPGGGGDPHEGDALAVVVPDIGDTAVRVLDEPDVAVAEVGLAPEPLDPRTAVTHGGRQAVLPDVGRGLDVVVRRDDPWHSAHGNPRVGHRRRQPARTSAPDVDYVTRIVVCLMSPRKARGLDARPAEPLHGGGHPRSRTRPRCCDPAHVQVHAVAPGFIGRAARPPSGCASLSAPGSGQDARWASRK